MKNKALMFSGILARLVCSVVLDSVSLKEQRL